MNYSVGMKVFNRGGELSGTRAWENQRHREQRGVVTRVMIVIVKSDISTAMD